MKDLEEDHACIPIKKSDPVVSYRETVSEVRAVPLKKPPPPPSKCKGGGGGGGVNDLEKDHACIPTKKSDTVVSYREAVSEVRAVH